MGVCDYIVSLSPEQLFISVPVLIIFEAKNENIKGGFAQCLSAMLAAQIFNEREGTHIPTIHGVVTTGTNWRFLQLESQHVRIDQREYYIDNVEKNPRHSTRDHRQKRASRRSRSLSQSHRIGSGGRTRPW